MKHGRAIVRRMEPSWWNKMKKNEWKLSFLFLASVKIFSNLLLDSSHFISFHIVSSDGIRSAPRTACILLSFYFSLAPVLMLRRTVGLTLMEFSSIQKLYKFFILLVVFSARHSLFYATWLCQSPSSYSHVPLQLIMFHHHSQFV